jgi:DNA-binding transcriptional regulator PaaX
MKTITILAREWFDKINGNSYFAGEIYIDNKEVAQMPFQYGFGEQYRYEAVTQLIKEGFLKDFKENESLYRYCDRKKINLLTSKQENCLKRDL